MPTEIVLSIEAKQVWEEAHDIAKRCTSVTDSGHLILAAFVVPCEAQSVLLEKGVNLDRLTDAVKDTKPDDPLVVSLIYSQACVIATNLGSKQVTSVHLLLSTTRFPDCRAIRALERIGVSLTTLRTHAMAHLTDPRLKRAATERLLSMGCLSPVWTTPNIHAHVQTPLATEEVKCHLPINPAKDEEKVAISERHIPKDIHRSRFSLDPVKFPLLTSLGRNLTSEAEQGLLDPLIGRRAEIEKMIDILCKRRANNPLLLGDPGVGKSAIVEGLARMIVERGEALPQLSDKIIVAISMTNILAGTQMRGSFAERMRELKEEVLSADRQVILFIDEIHTLVGAGSGDGPLDASNDLKGALARGEFPCIGATTFGEYQRYILPDQAFCRRFEPIHVYEPSLEESEEILVGIAPVYESFHQVRITREAITTAVRLSDRMIPERSLPAKAIDLIDHSASRVRRQQRNEVTKEDVIDVLSGLVGLPKEHLTLSPLKMFYGIKQFMSERVFGHEQAIEIVAKTLSQNWTRTGTRKPLGTFVLTGNKGVGKRTFAKVLAEYLFGSKDAILEINLSDYGEQHCLSFLLGSPPGYVGYEEGGLLGDTLVRHPLLLILWESIESAASAVQSTIAQIISEGIITDRRGRRLDFKNTVHCFIVHTFENEQERFVGFKNLPIQRINHAQMIKKCKKILPLEILTSVDQIVCFSPLDEDAIKKMIKTFLHSAVNSINAEFGIRIEVGHPVEDAIASLVVNSPCAGQMVERIVREVIITPAVEVILREEVSKSDAIWFHLKDGRILCEVVRNKEN